MNEENQVTEQKMIPYYVHEGRDGKAGAAY